MARTISKDGLELIKKHEALRLEAYLDPVGIPTIGYGHTGSDVSLGQVITEDQADALLRKDVKVAENAISGWVTVALTQAQFDALCSFIFNVGVRAFKGSTLLRLLNEGDYKSAAYQFTRWNKAKGKVLAGLTRRRAEERTLFEKGESADERKEP